MRTVLRRLADSVTGENADTLPVLIPAPPITPLALYLPASWDADAAVWRDLSGNNHDLPLTTGALVRQEVDGVDGLTFAGGDDLLRLASFAQAQPFSVFSVQKTTAMPVSGRTIVASFNGAVNMFHDYCENDGRGGSRGAATDITPVAGSQVNEWRTHGTVWNGASSVVRMDSTEGTGDLSATAATSLSVGAVNGDITAAGWKGHLAALVIFAAALDAGDRADMQAYLADITGRP